MEFAQIVAIVRPTVVAKIQRALQQANIPGMSLAQVKGYDDYADFFRADWLSTHMRLEVFVAAAQAEKIAELIMKAAHTGVEGDGLVAVMPVAKLYHIRTQQPCQGQPC